MIEELLQRNLIMFEKELISCGFYGFNGVQLTYMPIEYARKVDNNGFLNETRDYVYSDIYFEGNKVLIQKTVCKNLNPHVKTYKKNSFLSVYRKKRSWIKDY